MILCILSSWFSVAQEITINGIVNDETGVPIPGANVIEKGTTNGTVTDFDGAFTIKTEIGATLTFSYLGYISQNIVVKNSADLNIVLTEDLQQLPHLVVVN
ncbi:carboxypeptidase-like regulatory domain-containing protein, partial [Maribacter dokdonensis]|uniref:carboxypeptidase-like regulatory domain-containing protein n=1 Tax=Maribacter dokdonensis TaxID=320912 RepID=UPI00329A4D72